MNFSIYLAKISPYSYQGKNRKQHIVIDLALATICDHTTVHNELVNPALALVQGFDLYEKPWGSYVQNPDSKDGGSPSLTQNYREAVQGVWLPAG